RDQLLGEGAVAAADFDPVQAFRCAEPVEELHADALAPAAHHALVDLAVGEHLAGVAHGVPFTTGEIAGCCLSYRIVLSCAQLCHLGHIRHGFRLYRGTATAARQRAQAPAKARAARIRASARP